MWGKFLIITPAQPQNACEFLADGFFSLLFLHSNEFNYVRVKHAWNNSLERIDMVFWYALDSSTGKFFVITCNRIGRAGFYSNSNPSSSFEPVWRCRFRSRCSYFKLPRTIECFRIRCLSLQIEACYRKIVTESTVHVIPIEIQRKYEWKIN